MAGVLYGVGVGPGDPELMTLKAVRVIRENNVIAVPGMNPRETVAYKIAVAAVPELAEKTLLPLDMPMVLDKEVQKKAHEDGAKKIEQYLEKGENVVFLTLGDVTVYSTFAYVQEIVERDGFPISLINGIPSFCATAARLNLALGLWNEPIHILPGVHYLQEELPETGTIVFMKSASKMDEVKKMLSQSDRDVIMVENCGMENEKVYRSLEELPDNSGYYSLIIAKKK